jgi:hypothetical protein
VAAALGDEALFLHWLVALFDLSQIWLRSIASAKVGIVLVARGNKEEKKKKRGKFQAKWRPSFDAM